MACSEASIENRFVNERASGFIVHHHERVDRTHVFYRVTNDVMIRAASFTVFIED